MMKNVRLLTGFCGFFLLLALIGVGCAQIGYGSLEIVAWDEQAKTVVVLPTTLEVVKPGPPETHGVVVVPAANKLIFQGMIRMVASATELDLVRREAEKRWGSEAKTAQRGFTAVTMVGKVRDKTVFDYAFPVFPKNGLPIQGTVEKPTEREIPELQITFSGKPEGQENQRQWRLIVPLQ
jgi:hypothetical protein